MKPTYYRSGVDVDLTNIPWKEVGCISMLDGHEVAILWVDPETEEFNAIGMDPKSFIRLHRLMCKFRFISWFDRVKFKVTNFFKRG